MDLDTVFGASPLETYERELRSNGTLRYDVTEGMLQFTTSSPVQP